MEKFKLKEDSLHILEVHEGGTSKWFYSIDGNSKTRLDGDKGISLLEQRILKPLPVWKYACLRENHTFMILHYYHQKTGLQQLTKEEYTAIVGNGSGLMYNLYLVPGTKMRERGETKGIFIPCVAKDEVGKFWNDEFLKIQLYRGKQLCFEYIKGLFKQIGNGNGH